MNLNEFAKTISLKEGKKIQVNIAQIKEIMKCIFQVLSTYENEEIIKSLYKKKIINVSLQI